MVPAVAYNHFDGFESRHQQRSFFFTRTIYNFINGRVENKNVYGQFHGYIHLVHISALLLLFFFEVNRMTNFVDLELADYVLERINEGTENELIGIVEPSLIFCKRKINPFCVMFVDRIPEKIYSTKSGNLSMTIGDYCSITTSDGNKFICKGSYYSILRKIEAGMDTSGMPF